MASEERLADIDKKASTLPHVMLQRSEISIWSVLKQCFGKELSKITMPAVFNEPLSFVQRLCEYMEYSELLQRASDELDPMKRMELVAAFAVSSSASNWERVAKPFNPMLGETYELDKLSTLGFRMMCEQVSHHPPVSAFYADGPHFKFYGSVSPKLKFVITGKVEVQPKGVVTLELLKHNEVYVWNNVSCTIHNLILGKPFIEQHGKMEISCLQTGLKCCMDFKQTGRFIGVNTSHIEGRITGKKNEPTRCLYGVWTDFLASCDARVFQDKFSAWTQQNQADQNGCKPKRTSSPRPPASSSSANSSSASLKSLNSRASASNHSNATPSASVDEVEEEAEPDKVTEPSATGVNIPVLPGSVVLWRVFPRPTRSEQFYHFTLFALMLNELTNDMRDTLPPSDSRFREDMRLMENGQFDAASDEKHRLEEKQREARNARKKVGKEEWRAIWFVPCKHPVTKEESWRFTGDYWKRDWSQCPDII